MINVLKRLAELDSASPKVEKTTMVKENAIVAECGPLGMSSLQNGRPPASFSINATAADGTEVADMLSQIMSLAGVKPAHEEPAFAGVHPEIELEPAHTAEPEDGFIGMSEPAEPDHGGDLAAGGIGGNMADIIGKIDSLNTPDEPASDSDRVADMADEVESMTDQLKGDEVEEGDEDRMWNNSPDEKVEPHAYGDDQVTPKPQGLKQRQGDNPFAPGVTENLDKVAEQLLRDYQEFVNEAKTDYSAKKARAGKDIGKPGKNFAKIEKKAEKEYGSKKAGERVAGAVLAKLRKG